MILNPTILLLLLTHIVTWLSVSGKVLVVLSVKCRPRWSNWQWQIKLRTTAWEELVISRNSWQADTQVQVVTVTIPDKEVLPVLQHIACICKRHWQLEIVIRPTQTLTNTHACTQQFHELVWIQSVIIVIWVIVIVTIRIVWIAIHITIIVIVRVHTCLLWVEHIDREL